MIRCFLLWFTAFTFLWRSPICAKTNRFEAIDRHALSAPASVEKSVQSLARYLVRPAKNDEEKARAIFRWIAEHITYDTRSYFTGSIRSVESDDVLKNRTAVCGGFSGLFKSLGKEAGLDVENISGYAKGYDYRVGKRFKGPANHAWNAVRIDGTWSLFDATWGAGYINDQGRFEREFDEHFFRTPPGEMIYTHFPEDLRWQLLDSPVTLDAFEKQAYVKPAFFRYGLGLLSHPYGDIDAGDSIFVRLASPETIALSARIISGNRTLDGQWSFIQREADYQTIRASFPASGAYTLRLFAKKRNDPGLSEWAQDYLIRAQVRSGTPTVYPEVFQAFADKDCILFEPMRGRVKAGRRYAWSVRIPGAEKAAVISGNQWKELVRDGDWFKGNEVAAKGNIQLAAKFPGETQYDVLLQYAGY